MKYKYETHLHTRQASACGVASGAELVKSYYKAGYTGVIVTDHFFNGNTSVSSHLGWEERVNAFMKGFEDAFNEGKKYDMDVFFGWEACYHGTEFLIYGLDKEWLLHHEDILTWSIEEQYEQVTNSGGMVVHAHPFREAFYIPEVRLYPNHVDAVEVYNMSNERLDTEFNKRAKEYAEQRSEERRVGKEC